MNKLTIRLSLTMISAVVVAVGLVVSTQVLLLNQQYSTLPPDLRENLETVLKDQVLNRFERRALLREASVQIFQVLQASENSLLPFIDRFTMQQLVLLLSSATLAISLATGLALLVAIRTIRPVVAVAGAAEKVMTGDLAARASQQFATSGSEVGQLVQNFNAMAQTLERLQHERKQLVADIAHELRTPLTIVQGQLDAMQDGFLEPSQENLGILNEHVQLLTRLVKDLRLLSLADTGKLQLEMKAIDIHKLAERTLRSFQPKAKEKEVSMTFSSELREGLKLTIDADRIVQVLSNLLSNALRYTPREGTISLNLSELDNQCVLQVRDSGPGIPEGQFDSIFERFYRVDSSRNRASGGSGLGLAISKALVELHGGTIQAFNHQEKGAVFQVVLPLR